MDDQSAYQVPGPAPNVASGPQVGHYKNQRSAASTPGNFSNSPLSPMGMVATADFTDSSPATQENPNSPQLPSEEAWAQERTPTKASHQLNANFNSNRHGNPIYEQIFHTPQNARAQPYWKVNTQHSPQTYTNSPQNGRSEYRDYRNMHTPIRTHPNTTTPTRGLNSWGAGYNPHQERGQVGGYVSPGFPPTRFPAFQPHSRALNFGPQGQSYIPQQPTGGGMGPAGHPIPTAGYASLMGAAPEAGTHTPASPHTGWNNNHPQILKHKPTPQGPPPMHPGPRPLLQYTNTQTTQQREDSHHTGRDTQKQDQTTVLTYSILNDRADFDLTVLAKVVNMIMETDPGMDAKGPIEPIRATVGWCLNLLGVTHTGTRTQNIHNNTPTPPQEQKEHTSKEGKEGEEGTDDNSKTQDTHTPHTTEQQVDRPTRD